MNTILKKAMPLGVLAFSLCSCSLFQDSPDKLKNVTWVSTNTNVIISFASTNDETNGLGEMKFNNQTFEIYFQWEKNGKYSVHDFLTKMDTVDSNDSSNDYHYAGDLYFGGKYKYNEEDKTCVLSISEDLCFNGLVNSITISYSKTTK